MIGTVVGAIATMVSNSLSPITKVIKLVLLVLVLFAVTYIYPEGELFQVELDKI